MAVKKRKKITKSKFAKTNTRILKIMIFFGIIVTLVVANVLFTMVTGTHFRSGKNVLLEKSGSGLYTETIIANRGNIYDRNKEIIAQDIEAYDLIAIVDENRINGTNEPAHVVDVDDTCTKLASVLGVDADKLKPFLNNAIENNIYQTEFGSYGKTLTAQQKEDIEALNLPGIEFNKSTDRVYPVGVFASQLIGYAQYNYDDDKISGVMGLENIFDEELSGTNGEIVYQTDSDGNYIPKTKKYTKTAENGNDIYLTLDKNVQLTVEKALSNTMESNKAEKAWCVVMEAKTGKVLAQAGYPTFDLNKRENIENYLNLPSEFAFECGSVMKPFVYAGAIEEGVYNGSLLFNSGSKILGYDDSGNVVELSSEDAQNYVMTIRDALGKDYGTISYDEGLIRSTNTAIVSLLLNQYNSDSNIANLKKFGFFKKIGIYGVNESSGLLNTDDIFSKITVGFGQGSTVTAYQLVQAASAIFTDGKMVKPYIIDKIVNPNTGETTYQGKTEKSEQVISTATVTQIQDLLKRVVSESYGTAHHYAMSDVSIMAKTGTGEISVDGSYSTTTFTTSIMAAAPSDDPEIIVYYAFQSKNIQYYDVSYFQEIVREALIAIDGYSKSSTQTNTSSTSTMYNVFTMPSLVNHSLTYVNSKLDSLTQNIYKISDGENIIAQYPLASTTTISSQKIFLLSDGSTITMPNMSGWSRKDVLVFAKLTGIDIKINGSGSVNEQSVAEGVAINEDSEISVTLK